MQRIGELLPGVVARIVDRALARRDRLGLCRLTRRGGFFVRGPGEASGERRLRPGVALLVVHHARDERRINANFGGDFLHATVAEAVFTLVSGEDYLVASSHLLTFHV